MDLFGEMRETTANGTTIAWWEAGSGTPLLLLHGLIDSHRTWRRTAPMLASTFHLYMPDLPGFGLSGRPDAPYTLTWFARTMAAWMDSIGLSKAHICGHSYGGGVGQWMVAEARNRVDRLALVAPGGFGRGIGAGIRFIAIPGVGRRIAPVVLRNLMPRALRHFPQLFGNIEAEELNRFVEWSRIAGSGRTFYRTVRGAISFFGQYMQAKDRVEEIKELPPVALFWGEKDSIIPISQGRKALEISKGITLTEYKGCGHFPHLEYPGRFAADLTNFLLDPDRPDAVVHVE